MSGCKKLAEAVSLQEHKERIDRILSHPGAENAEGFLWWGNHRIFYLAGFAFVPTERPIALIIDKKGSTLLFVPRLELEHARAYAGVDDVISYPEYPDYEHPMIHLSRIMKDKGIKRNFFGDGDGYGKVMGYKGPRISELTEACFHPFDDIIEKMMQVKSPHEIELIRESARWACHVHRYLQEYTKIGLTENEVEMKAAWQAQQDLINEYQGKYRALSWGGNGPGAGYRGQVGQHSALPHSLNINAVFKAGDTLVTGASCPMFGYWSELERTMFIKNADESQTRYFSHMLELQNLAIDACRPGKTCSSVDRKVREYFDFHSLKPFWRHHTGHNIGIRYHEGPFLDIGDETVMEPGMLFTVEPGIYVEGLGGFRHSDTILVTEGEPEFLTSYPRDIESLILPG